MKPYFHFLGNTKIGQVCRSALLFCLLLVLSTYCVILGLALRNRSDEERLRSIMRIIGLFSRIMHRFLIGEVIIRGENNISNDGPVIFVSNHESYWEAIVMPVILCPTVFIVKKYVTSIPLAGLVISLTPLIVIDPQKKGSKDIFNQCQKKLQQGINILFYPQGTRTPAGVRASFRKGAFVVALETNTPIVPIATNSEKIWKNACTTSTGDVTISIGKKIDPAGKTLEELIRETENWIYQERDSL